MTTRRKATPTPTPKAASDTEQAVRALRSLLDSIEHEELAATGEQVARLQGAVAVLSALSQLQDEETGSAPPPDTPK